MSNVTPIGRGHEIRTVREARANLAKPRSTARPVSRKVAAQWKAQQEFALRERSL